MLANKPADLWQACFNAKCFILRLLGVCCILSTCQFSEKCDIESIWMTVIGANQLAKKEDEIISSKLFFSLFSGVHREWSARVSFYCPSSHFPQSLFLSPTHRQACQPFPEIIQEKIIQLTNFASSIASMDPSLKFEKRDAVVKQMIFWMF